KFRHVIEKRTQDVAVKLQKKMERNLTGSHGGEEGHYHELPYEPHNEYPLQPDHMTTPLLC
ncbi:hypothetical protein HID58_088294, partial [Brassica napus]